jgi:hypothetical protein
VLEARLNQHLGYVLELLVQAGYRITPCDLCPVPRRNWTQWCHKCTMGVPQGVTSGDYLAMLQDAIE